MISGVTWCTSASSSAWCLACVSSFCIAVFLMSPVCCIRCLCVDGISLTVGSGTTPTPAGAGRSLLFLSSFPPTHQILPQPGAAWEGGVTCEGGGSCRCFSLSAACALLLMKQVGSVRFVAYTPVLSGFDVIKVDPFPQAPKTEGGVREVSQY